MIHAFNNVCPTLRNAPGAVEDRPPSSTVSAGLPFSAITAIGLFDVILEYRHTFQSSPIALASSCVLSSLAANIASAR